MIGISNCLSSLKDYTLDNPQAPQLLGYLVGSLASEYFGSIWDRYLIHRDTSATFCQPNTFEEVNELLRTICLPDDPVVIKASPSHSYCYSAAP